MLGYIVTTYQSMSPDTYGNGHVPPDEYFTFSEHELTDAEAEQLRDYEEAILQDLQRMDIHHGAPALHKDVVVFASASDGWVSEWLPNRWGKNYKNRKVERRKPRKEPRLRIYLRNLRPGENKFVPYKPGTITDELYDLAYANFQHLPEEDRMGAMIDYIDQLIVQARSKFMK